MRVVIPQHKQNKIQKTNDNTICPSHSLCSQPVVKPSSSTPCSGLPTRVFPRATILASKSKPNSSYFLPLVTSQNPNTVFGFIRSVNQYTYTYVYIFIYFSLISQFLLEQLLPIWLFFHRWIKFANQLVWLNCRAYRFSFILFSSSRECFCEH